MSSSGLRKAYFFISSSRVILTRRFMTTYYLCQHVKRFLRLFELMQCSLVLMQCSLLVKHACRVKQSRQRTLKDCYILKKKLRKFKIESERTHQPEQTSKSEQYWEYFEKVFCIVAFHSTRHFYSIQNLLRIAKILYSL